MDGVVTYTVRFMESERYDVMSDQQMIRLMAVCTNGSYSAEIPRDTASMLRVRRKAFKEYVLNSLACGGEPHEIEGLETLTRIEELEID